MSCGLALATTLLLTNPDVALAASVDPATVPADLTGLAAEPLFIDIVSRSGRLKSVAEGWAETGAVHAPGFLTGSDWLTFRTEATALGELNLQGHLILKSRESEGDMTCILRGLSEDLPVRLADMEAADSAGARDLALAVGRGAPVRRQHRRHHQPGPDVPRVTPGPYAPSSSSAYLIEQP